MSAAFFDPEQKSLTVSCRLDDLSIMFNDDDPAEPVVITFENLTEGIDIHNAWAPIIWRAV